MEKIGQVVEINGSVAKVYVKRTIFRRRRWLYYLREGKAPWMYIYADNQAEAVPGQEVKVQIQTKAVLKGAALAYTFPLIMFFMGILIGYFLHSKIDLSISPDVFAFIIGLLFIIISYFIVRIIYQQKNVQKNIEYKIVEKF